VWWRLNRGQLGFEAQSTAISAAGAAAADGVENVSGVVVAMPFTHIAQVGSQQQPVDRSAIMARFIGAVGNVRWWWFSRFDADAPRGSLWVRHTALSSLPVSLGRLTALICLDSRNNHDMPQRMQVHFYNRDNAQAFLRPFRCALKCQPIVIIILGTFRRWNWVRLPPDMARCLAKLIWNDRENPIWSK